MKTYIDSIECMIGEEMNKLLDIPTQETYDKIIEINEELYRLFNGIMKEREDGIAITHHVLISHIAACFYASIYSEGTAATMDFLSTLQTTVNEGIMAGSLLRERLDTVLAEGTGSGEVH